MRDAKSRQDIIDAFDNMFYDTHEGSILAVLKICHQNLRYFGGTEWNDIARDINIKVQEEMNS